MTLVSAVLVYVLYYALIYGAKDKINRYLEELQTVLKNYSKTLPSVSVIISTFEESKVIRRKLQNTAELDYPRDRMEIIVIDDASQDKTGAIAEKALAEFNLKGKIISNPKRVGLNASLNLAIEAASNDVVCITDSDVALEKDALKNVVSVLDGIEGIGGVTGNIVPSFDDASKVTSLEKDYRSFSNRSMLGESYRHSAFPGSGVLTIFRRSALPSLIPVQYGSTDGNLSMSIIKGGHRFVYVPYANVYEPVPEDVGQHRLQKVRRAKRLIQVMLHNTDVLFNKQYGGFGSVVFPLKFAMFIFCPLLMVIGAASLIVFILLSQNLMLQVFLALVLVATALSLVLHNRVADSAASFVLHQFYLIVGLFSSFRKGTFWKKIDRR